MKQHIPKNLLKQIQAVLPPHAEVVSLPFTYDDEDYNLAVFVPEEVDRAALQDRLYDLVFDYDDTHGTSTLCYVWPTRDRPAIVAA
jgi:hypothetical protein